jgi:hypothetical protein
VLENKKFYEWANENVLVVVGHTQAEHEFEEVDGEGGEKVKNCKLYVGLTCAQHEAAAQDCHSGAGDLPKIEQKSGVPNSWLVAPTGEIREIEPGEQQVVSKIIDAAEAWQKDLGKFLTAKKYEDCQEDLATGDAALEKKDFKGALKVFAKIEKDEKKLPEPMVASVAKRIEAVNEAVRAALEELKGSEADAESRLKEARQLSSQVSLRLKSGYLPVKEELEAFIKELKQ